MAENSILLEKLFSSLCTDKCFEQWRAITVTGIKEDSRYVVVGDLFVARDGEHFKGTDFIEGAISRGAVAVVVEKVTEQPNKPDVDLESYSVPVIALTGLAFKLGEIAAAVFGNVVQSLNVIGITGTNGKTSCAHYIAQALNNLGVNTFIIGTLGNGHPDSLEQASRTTPDACSLQQLFAQFYAQGAKAVVMEVSSHALEQGRVQSVPFNLVAYTNLSQDHLDYHGTMQAYAQAKAKLFTDYSTNHCVLNLDDEYNQQLLEHLHDTSSAELSSYSEIASSGANFVAKNVNLQQGLAFELCAGDSAVKVETTLLGKFNVANLLLCAASLNKLGFSLDQVKHALAVLSPVPGRMQQVGLSSVVKQPLCVVDYAHTPDALEKALLACRVHTQAKLLVVFGCGGDRDQSKRALMAKVAERFADQLVITSDNPRTENPEAIIEMIKTGLSADLKYQVESNRQRAIVKAVNAANAGDVVLIAGKGHEDYQEIMGVKHHFLDEQVVREALVEKSKFSGELLL